MTITNISCAVELPRRNEVRKRDRRQCEGESMMKDLSDLLRKINTLKNIIDDFSPTLFQSVTVITPESTLRFMGGKLRIIAATCQFRI
jgi:hypothetical protein